MDRYPVLIPLTREAKLSIFGQTVRLTRFPFRIGRESRVTMVHGEWHYMERRKSKVPPNNELYLFDEGELKNISREHFQIERDDNGEYFLFDRGSACGTVVDDVVIGGKDRTGRHPLREGSVIVIGTETSPYRFEFRLEAPE